MLIEILSRKPEAILTEKLSERFFPDMRSKVRDFYSQKCLVVPTIDHEENFVFGCVLVFFLCFPPKIKYHKPSLDWIETYIMLKPFSVVVQKFFLVFRKTGLKILIFRLFSSDESQQAVLFMLNLGR